MREQPDILAEGWDTLIVMDAARADVTVSLDPRFDTCRATWGITHRWCAELWDSVEEPLLHITANPVPHWKQSKHPGRWPHVRVMDLTEDYWQRREGLGLVDPADVTTVAREAIPRFDGRVVVHYLQPHAPYAAQPLPVPVANIPGEQDDDMDVCEAIEKGVFTWADLKASYLANLGWVLPEATGLAQECEGRVIVTADHGEALGEEGHYGHTGVPFPIIRDVPIWVLGNGEALPPRVATLLRHLARLDPGARVLEVGRLRRAQETDAHSTKHLADHPNVARVVSIDVSEKTEDVCREVLEDVGKIEFVNANSLDALAGEWEPFDFGYLDSANDAEHSLKELLLAEQHLAPGAVVIFDDAEIEKGRLTSLYVENSPRWEVVERVSSIPGKTFFGNLIARWKG